MARKRAPLDGLGVERESRASKFASDLVERLSAKFGKNVATLLSETPEQFEVRSWLTTGFPWFDWMLSDGRGVPVGRVIEFWGKYSTGKSAFAQKLVRTFQDAGGCALYIDTENATRSRDLIGYDVDPKRFIGVRPETMEQAFDVVFACLRQKKKDKKEKKSHQNAPLLIVWDSIAQSLPSVENEETSFGKATIGVVSRALSKACRKLPLRVSRLDATMIFINQTRANIGAQPFEEQDVRPGGQALDFASSTLIRFRKIKRLTRDVKKGGKEVYGYLLRLATDKNRIAPPHRSCEIILDFERGPNENASLLHFLTKQGQIVAAGTRGLKLKGGKETFGKKEWRTFRKENAAKVENAVEAAVESLTIAPECELTER